MAKSKKPKKKTAKKKAAKKKAAKRKTAKKKTAKKKTAKKKTAKKRATTKSKATTKRRAALDHQQEFERDPVLVPDFARMPALLKRSSIRSLSEGETSYSDIYETICGTTDDSQPVESYDGTLGVTQQFVNNHQRPVGVLRWNSNLASIYDNPGNVSGVRWCTGTLISNDLFLTAGHCFDQTGGGWQRPRVNGTTNIISPDEIAVNMSVEFNYQDDPLGNPRTPVSVAVVELVEYRLGGLDFAIARLDGTPGTTWGFTRVATTDPAVNDMLAIIGHPAGQRKRIEAGPLTSLSGDLVFYNDIDTLGGNSGSGLLRESDGRIVGVHTNGGCNAAMTGSNFGVSMTAIRRESPTIRGLVSVLTSVLADAQTTLANDRMTTIIADRATTIISDRLTTVLSDRLTSVLADYSGTSVLLDTHGTHKAIDDRKTAALDKQFSDRKLPGQDTMDDWQGGTVIRRDLRGKTAQPFVLATPHHAEVAAGQSQLAELEQALAQLELAMQETASNYDQLQAEYERLAAEYAALRGG